MEDDKLRAFVFACVLAMGCGQDSGSPGASDMSVATVYDLSTGGDMTPPLQCSMVDPMTDGQSCGSGSCPGGTIGVGAGAACQCWQICDPATPTVCPCDRRCAELTRGDAGVVGGACLPANGPGERCGESGVSGVSTEGCAQGLICVNADDAGMFRYCVYDCTGNTSCPIQTACLPLTGTNTMACAYDSMASGLAPGATCKPNDSCVTGYLCDGTCKPQCDRTGANCASGSCTALSDGTRTVGYVCE